MMYKTPKERRSEIWNRGFGAAGVGGLILGVGAALPLAEIGGKIVEPAICTSFIIFGTIIIVIGLIFVCIAFFWPPDDRDQDHSCRPARSEEIQQMIDFCQEHLPPIQMPTAKQMQDLHCINHEIFYIVERRHPNGSNQLQMVGCFTLIPLKQRAVDSLNAGEIEGGLEIEGKHVARKKGYAKAVYVGVVIGVDLASKGYVMSALGWKISAFCQKGPIRIFGRPISEDGLRLMRKHKFLTVAARGEARPEMNFVCYKDCKSADGIRHV